MYCSIIFLVQFLLFPTQNLMMGAETGGSINQCKKTFFTPSEAVDKGNCHRLLVENWFKKFYWNILWISGLPFAAAAV